MRMRALYLGTALSVVMAASANATIVGSTYDFTASATGGTAILATNGTYTDPANPGFCVGPPTACASGAGLSGAFTFAKVSPTSDTITFTFFGGTSGSVGTFAIDLGNFKTTDGESITDVTYASGNLTIGSFTSVTWNGTDAVFTGSGNPNYGALGGQSVVFDVATSGASVPEPASLTLFGTALLAFGAFAALRRRRKTG